MIDKYKLRTLCGEIRANHCERHNVDFPYGERCPECSAPAHRGPVAKTVVTDPAPMGAMAKALREAGYIPRRQ
jgi:hypothetical protein